MRPLYIVSSISRSGSSMAMRCLEAGGLDAVYDGSHEHFNATADADYLPNPGGFLALGEDFRDPAFHLRYEGRLVKVPWRELVTLPAGDYRVLFMLRDPREIAASMERFGLGFGSERVIAETCYQPVVDALLSKLEARGDFTVSTLRYARVVADAEAQFASLGWPIDARAAASVVDESLHRFRLESK